MNIRQVWYMAGGFFAVYFVISLTNRPVLHPRVSDAGAAAAPQANPAADSNATQPAPAAAAQASDFQHGMCLVAPGTSGMKDPAIDAAFQAIAATGAGWVAICPTLTQDTFASSRVVADPLDSPTASALADGVAHAHARHLKVMLRPRLVSRDGTRPEAITPTDAGIWLGNYQAALDPWLDVAKENRVETVCLGGPFSHLERAPGWVPLIRHVRERFPGTLTYAAATTGDRGAGGYQQVPFWGQLDCVGIDAIVPATAKPGDPNWRGLADTIEAWQPAIGKGVILTGVGLPADAAGSQARAARGFFDAFASRRWLTGAYWLGWNASATREVAPYAPLAGGAIAELQSHFAHH